MGTDNVGIADARVAATIAIAASAGVSVMGFFLAPGWSVTLDWLVVEPLIVGFCGYLLIVLVVDPLLRRKPAADRRTAIRWLSRTVEFRLAVIAFTAPAGLWFASASTSYLPLVTGALVSVGLGVLWWPGRRCFERLLGAVVPSTDEPVIGERVAEQVRAKNKGRIVLTGRRASGSFT
jgi:hypothetical protein